MSHIQQRLNLSAAACLLLWWFFGFLWGFLLLHSIGTPGSPSASSLRDGAGRFLSWRPPKVPILYVTPQIEPCPCCTAQPLAKHPGQSKVLHKSQWTMNKPFPSPGKRQMGFLGLVRIQAGCHGLQEGEICNHQNLCSQPWQSYPGATRTSG